jgi:hypothetical protein
MSEGSEEQRQRLRAQIAERLAAGILPPFSGQLVFGGRGEGKPCGCCDRPIAASDVQYDLDHQARNILMHLPCYRLWVEVSESSKPV